MAAPFKAALVLPIEVTMTRPFVPIPPDFHGKPLDHQGEISFRAFCQRSTDAQLREIVQQERRRASAGDRYYQSCYDLALAEARSRGLEVG